MSQAKPIIVLVPGGFCSPAVYEGVANILRQDGFTVKIPSLAVTRNLPTDDSRTHELKDLAKVGLLDDVEQIHRDICPLLDEGHEAVIFGHSYGSLPAMAAIEGQSVQERAAKGLPGGIKAYGAISGFAYAMRGRNVLGSTEAPPPQPYHNVEDGVLHIEETAKPLFFSDLSAEEQDAAWKLVLGCQSSKSLNHLAEFITTDVRVPKTYIACENDAVVPQAYQEMFITSGEFGGVERLPSGHFPFLSMPEDTARVLGSIATA